MEYVTDEFGGPFFAENKIYKENDVEIIFAGFVALIFFWFFLSLVHRLMLVSTNVYLEVRK